METCQNCNIPLKVKVGKFGQFLGCSNFPRCRYTLNLPRENSGNNDWITASSVGKASYCPYSVYLESQGVIPSQESYTAMEKGRLSHVTVTRAAMQPVNAKRCYIATYAFGENDPIVVDLRSWRDSTLLKTRKGRLFVRFYYGLSPWLIRIFGNSQWFRSLAIKWVLWFHHKIQQRVN